MRLLLLALLFIAAACSTVRSNVQRPDKFEPSTSSTAAASHFRSGLLMYYAYNPAQSFREFRSAARADSHFSIAWWGLAISKAGNLNVDTTPERLALAQRAIRRARGLERYANPEERTLIEALSERLLPANGTEHLDRYAQAMAVVAARYPNDADIQTLYGAALLEAASGLGDKPPERPELSSRRQRLAYDVLERTFRKSGNIGAAHFLIHAAELTGSLSSTQSAADALIRESLPAAASHLPHMAAHVYLSQHRWAEMASAAARALQMDRSERRAKRTRYDSSQFYYEHNLNFLLYALLQRGRRVTAVNVARRSDSEDAVSEAMLAVGNYDAIAATPAVGSLTSLFAHGIAAARRGEPEQAVALQRRIDALVSSDTSGEGRTLAATTDTLIRSEVLLRAGDRRGACAGFQSRRDAAMLRSGDLPMFYYYPLKQRLDECAHAQSALQMRKL